MGLIDFLNVLLRLNIPLFCVLMFMKGQTASATQAAAGESPGSWGSSPARGPAHPPAVPPKRSHDRGGCSPPEMFTQKGMQRNLICVYNLCILLGFPNFWNVMTILECTQWRNGEMLPGLSWLQGPETLPFSTKHHRAEKGEEAEDSVHALSQIMCDAGKSKRIWQI